MSFLDATDNEQQWLVSHVILDPVTAPEYAAPVIGQQGIEQVIARDLIRR
jgi:hypothetical protein